MCRCMFWISIWRNSNESNKNTKSNDAVWIRGRLLERLSDEDTVWQRIGKHVSSEFKCYVNQELLTTNLMMCGVKPLE